MHSNYAESESNKYGKVAVLMGGGSAEREISLMSGQQVLTALLDSGVDAHAVDADRDVVSKLRTHGFDRAFIILHGYGGEDGQIQGALQINQIPYTGSGVRASALAFNKLKAKEVCSAYGILTPKWALVATLEECISAAGSIGLPIVVKPISEGSSIGVSIVNHLRDVEQAWNIASNCGDVIVEKFIKGFEVTSAILGEEALPLVSMSTDRVFYDYTAKYFDDNTRYQCPCESDLFEETEVQEIALKVFSVLGAHGWGRVDFIIDEEGQANFIELNTIPGMTSHSLVPIAAKQNGVDFATLCVRILDSSIGNRK